MIFVTLGTQKFQLNRLLKQLDKYIEQGQITDKVIAQIGYSDYLPMIEAADIVIAHSGVGSIIRAINSNKPVIVYPRLAKYREHIDDHQLEIAYAFSVKNYVLCCGEEDDLLEKIEESRTHHFEKYVSQREKIVGIIDEYLRKN